MLCNKNILYFGGIEQQRGFTLIEMIIAIAIFGVLSTIVYEGLSHFVDMRERILHSHTKLSDLQTARTLMQNDLRFLVIRKPKVDYRTNSQYGFQVNAPNALLKLTAIHQNYLVEQSSLARYVEWRLDKGTLIREVFWAMDPVRELKSAKTYILNDVHNVRISSLNVKTLKPISKKKQLYTKSLPRLLSIEITLKSGSEFRWVFETAHGG